MSFYFLLLLGFVGYSIGTITLLLPLRWVVDYIRDHGYSANTEKAAVIGLIILVLIVTIWISKLIFDQLVKEESFGGKLKWLIVPILLFSVSIWLFFQPKLINPVTETSVTEISIGYTIGPFPERGKLMQLKAQGYDGIISLLHPLIVPFEPVLINQLKSQTTEIGL